MSDANYLPEGAPKASPDRGSHPHGNFVAVKAGPCILPPHLEGRNLRSIRRKIRKCVSQRREPAHQVACTLRKRQPLAGHPHRKTHTLGLRQARHATGTALTTTATQAQKAPLRSIEPIALCCDHYTAEPYGIHVARPRLNCRPA